MGQIIRTNYGIPRYVAVILPSSKLSSRKLNAWMSLNYWGVATTTLIGALIIWWVKVPTDYGLKLDLIVLCQLRFSHECQTFWIIKLVAINLISWCTQSGSLLGRGRKGGRGDAGEGEGEGRWDMSKCVTLFLLVTLP